MQTRTREFQERAQQDYQKKQNELLAPIIDKAKSAIDKVAAAGGFWSCSTRRRDRWLTSTRLR